MSNQKQVNLTERELHWVGTLKELNKLLDNPEPGKDKLVLEFERELILQMARRILDLEDEYNRLIYELNPVPPLQFDPLPREIEEEEEPCDECGPEGLKDMCDTHMNQRRDEWQKEDLVSKQHNHEK